MLKPFSAYLCPSGVTVILLNSTISDLPDVTLKEMVASAVNPSLSVTVHVTSYTPAASVKPNVPFVFDFCNWTSGGSGVGLKQANGFEFKICWCVHRILVYLYPDLAISKKCCFYP